MVSQQHIFSMKQYIPFLFSVLVLVTAAGAKQCNVTMNSLDLSCTIGYSQIPETWTCYSCFLLNNTNGGSYAGACDPQGTATSGGSCSLVKANIQSMYSGCIW